MVKRAVSLINMYEDYRATNVCVPVFEYLDVFAEFQHTHDGTFTALEY